MATVQSAPNGPAPAAGAGLNRLPPGLTREQVQQAYVVRFSLDSS